MEIPEGYEVCNMAAMRQELVDGKYGMNEKTIGIAYVIRPIKNKEGAA